MRKSTCLVVIAVLLACLPLAGQEQTPRKDPTQRKKANQPRRRDNDKNLVRLAAPTGGIVQSVPVKEGQKVKKGDILLRFDDRLAKLQVLRAKMKIKKAEFERQSAVANFKGAESIQARAIRLRNQGAISEEEIVMKNLEVEMLQHKVQACRVAVQLAETDLAEADVHLDRLTIRAPADGVVQRILYQPGEGVEQLVPVVVIQLQDTKD